MRNVEEELHQLRNLIIAMQCLRDLVTTVQEILENLIVKIQHAYDALVQLYDDYKDQEMHIKNLEDELSETKSLTYRYSNDGESIADFLERSQDDE